MTDEAMPASAKRRRVLLGEITGVHGIRGDIVVRSYTANPADIASYGPLETAGGLPLPELSVVRVSDRGVIARLAGIADRTTAERFKGTELWVARDRLPAAVEGEYYHADLIGLAAVDPGGTPFGEVVAVSNFGGGDLLEIKLADNRSEFVPFQNAFVPDVDLAGGRVTVIMPVEDEDDEGDDPPAV
jgi:16S rRNA processing protein RimM